MLSCYQEGKVLLEQKLHEYVKISLLNEACIHCFCPMSVFQLLHALISAWLVFLALHSEGF